MKSIQLQEIKKNTIVEQVFLKSENGHDFFQGQIERNDSLIEDKLSNKKIKVRSDTRKLLCFFNGCDE